MGVYEARTSRGGLLGNKLRKVGWANLESLVELFRIG